MFMLSSAHAGRVEVGGNCRHSNHIAVENDRIRRAADLARDCNFAHGWRHCFGSLAGDGKF